MAGKPEESWRSAEFPVIGVGAGERGAEAFAALLRSLSRPLGAAFVLILHDRQNEAVLPMLADASRMKVVTVDESCVVAPDHLYLVPAGVDASMHEGTLRVGERDTDDAVAMPVDYFFRSLAADQGSRAIGIILSGRACDGALGTKAIKGEGGITFAQDDSAVFSAMPRASVVGGTIDFVLPPEQIGAELGRMVQHSYLSGDNTARLPESELLTLFGMLQAGHDLDFTNYKPSTVERRIRRRMALQKIETLGEYLDYIRQNPDELRQLYADMLIRVTSFFRDPEVFEALKDDILTPMLQGRKGEMQLRVWVPGCATGEEAYSLAITLLELVTSNGYSCPIQIFATDVSEDAVERARAGVYPESIAVDVSAERLRRYFTKVDGGYRVSKAVRDCCVFARQNLTSDPPFSNLDLISCRNVMIYLGSVLQRKVMSIFHYALRPDGHLLLGSSETVGNFSDLFSVIDRKHKVYQKKVGVRVPLSLDPPSIRTREQHKTHDEESQAITNVFREADRVVLSRYAPAGVVINDSLEVVQFRGRTSAYLEPSPGAASFNVLKMAREGLLAELRAAIHKSKRLEGPVRHEAIRVRTAENQLAFVNLDVIPFATASKERYQVILFEQHAIPAEPEVDPKKKKRNSAESLDGVRLRRELDATREYLQSIIEEQEAMNEELRSANEEIQSSNEELQSTNEELETAKEELQSSNEELTTLNEELETRNQELAEANNDLLNLLASVDIPIVMLDQGLRIRRFNPGAQRTLNLIPSDVGRPIGDLKTTLLLDHLEALIAEVIDQLVVRELEVQDRNGTSYSLRIRPYKTTENKIDGAVLVLIELSK